LNIQGTLVIALLVSGLLTPMHCGWTECIEGTPEEENLKGTSTADNILGQGGSDVLDGLDGNDEIAGNEGDCMQM
jgi:Ca2+-binding RTX toxin-like protein